MAKTSPLQNIKYENFNILSGHVIEQIHASNLVI